MELLFKIDDLTTNQFDKLVNDAISELNVLYHHFKLLPRYTREEFEAGEAKHFDVKLSRQIQGVHGATESLVNMQQDLPSFFELEDNITLLLQNSVRG